MEIRLAAVQESIKRTPLAIFFSLAASLASLVCIWNTFGSIDRWDSFQMELLPKCYDAGTNQGNTACYDSPEIKKDNPAVAGAVETEMYKRLADNWIDSTYIEVPILGSKVSIMDLGIYNSLAMLLFTLYLLLSQCRENREVAWLVKDMHANKYSFDEHYLVCETVYRAISAYLIFSLPTPDDRSIGSLSKSNRSIRRSPTRQQGRKGGNGALQSGLSKVKALRGVITCVFWLPTFAIAVSLTLHVVTIFRSGARFWGGTGLWISFGFGTALEVLSLVYVVYLTIKLVKFHNDTGGIINEFGQFTEDLGLPSSTQALSRLPFLAAPLSAEAELRLLAR